MAAAKTCAALTAHRIDLVNEYNGGRNALGLIEQVTHTARADADIEFDKVRAGNGKKCDVRLTGNGSRQQRFACAWRTDQKNTLGDFCAQLLELLRVTQEFYNFREFFLFLVCAGNILEGNGFAIWNAKTCICARKLRHGVRTAAGTVHQNEPDEQKRNANNQIWESGPPDGSDGGKVVVGLENAGCTLCGNSFVEVLVECLNVADFGGCCACLLCAAAIQSHGQRIALQNERLDPFGFKQVEHVGISKPAAVLREQGRRDHHKHQRQNCDQNDCLNGFGLLIHGSSPLERIE